jgi:peptidoglycan hydrolase CwlO-like protein
LKLVEKENKRQTKTIDRLEKELESTKKEIIKTENRIKGPLMAEIKIKEALIERFENRD